MAVQRNFTVNPDVGFPGMIAEPESPTRVQLGRLNVASASTRTNPRPGDSLFYSTANDAWQVPTSAAEQILVEGILSYRQDDVQNADSILQYSSGDEIEIVTMGVVWVIAGAAVERGNQIQMLFSDFKYDPLARVSAIADIRHVPIVAYNEQAAGNNDIIKAAIGYGRVI